MDKYPYWVEYIENGIVCSDSWSAKTLADELLTGIVQILSVTHKSLLQNDN